MKLLLFSLASLLAHVTFHVVENLVISIMKQLICIMGELTAVKNRVFTSTNCIPKPTVK